MYIVLLSVLGGLLLGVLLGGRLANLVHLEIRFGWVLVLAVTAQLVIALRLARDPAMSLGLAGGGLAGTYLAVLGVCWFNRRWLGMWIIGVGVLLNLMAAAPQGGLMPTTPDALRLAGRPVPAALPPPGARPYVSAKDVVLPRDQIPMWPLSDWLIFPPDSRLSGRISPFSPGDVVVAAGLAWLLARSMRAGPTLASVPSGESFAGTGTRSTSTR